MKIQDIADNFKNLILSDFWEGCDTLERHYKRLTIRIRDDCYLYTTNWNEHLFGIINVLHQISLSNFSGK